MPRLIRHFLLCLMCFVCGNDFSHAQSTSDTTFLEHGIYYLTLKAGKQTTKSIPTSYWIKYRTWLADGEMVDESNEQGILVNLKEEGFIPGWYILLPALSKGVKVKSFIPSTEAYGIEGQRDPRNYESFVVPPHSDLWFEIEVLNTK